MGNMLPPPPPARSLDDIIASIGPAASEPPAGSLATGTAPLPLTNQSLSSVPTVDSPIDEVILKMSRKYPETIEMFVALQQNQLLTFCKKANDYGMGNILLGGNIDDADDRVMALRGIAIRMNDKMERVKNLVLKNNQSQNESVDDSFLDISVYGLIALLVINQKWGK